jgi:2-dehydro-3-deoxyphosphogluconate aldolase/(4S)-4-hydroxy-2-oxoglutarate aldolase
VQEVAAAATRPAIPAGIIDGRVVAIGRRIPVEAAPTIAEALAAGGVRAFELTLNDPEADALRSIEAASRVASGLGLDIGAGTVLSIEAARRALDAGATFLVMPHFDPDLVAWAAERNIPSLPGCATPTETFAAWTAGAAAVKVFPASSVGPGFIRELRGPFPDIPLVPTGGLTLETAPAFIAAGAIAVGIGGWLVGNGDPEGVQGRAAAVVAAVNAAHAGSAG